MPLREAIGTLSVPMSNPLYTAVESQLTISPRTRSANARAKALLPVAVGPTIAMTVPTGTSILTKLQSIDAQGVSGEHKKVNH